MDGFSVTSLTSLCDTISHAAVSANTELSDLLRAIPNEKAQQSLTSLYGSLQSLGNEITQLQKSLTQASVLSESLRSQLQEYLSDCQRTLASLNKQILRLDPSLADRISHTYLSTRKEYFTAHCQLLRFFTTTLHM
jgi:predicted  nucleic acid-binding Zn-ribbon protein